MKYCLYELVDPRNQEPFYIGLTSNKEKRLKNHCKTCNDAFKSNKFKTKIIYELKKQNLKPIMNVLFEELSLQEAKELEIDFILKMKLVGYKLTNISPGGCLPSNETKIKLASVQKGKKHSKETKARISQALKGRRLSVEHRKKISKATKGENNSLFGKKHSVETKNKMSEASKNMSNEIKKKISESTKGVKNHFYGKKHSKESMNKRRIKKLGIEIVQKLDSYEWLYNEYIFLKKSLRDIAKENNISINPIRTMLKKHNIVKPIMPAA